MGYDEASVQRRLEVGADEQHRGRRMADHVVVNDDLGRATKELQVYWRVTARLS